MRYLSAPRRGTIARHGSAGIAAFLLGLIAASAVLFWLVPPGSLREAELGAPLHPRPFGDGSYRIDVRLPWWASINRAVDPAVKVYENGKLLRHRIAKDPGAISEPGAAVSVLFRTSDNSDPNGNGRTYAVHYTRAAVPLPLCLGIVVVALTAAFGLVALLVERALGRRATLRRIALATTSTLYAVLLLESMSAVALADRLAGEPAMRAQLQRVLDADAERSIRANTANFTSHPYLDFVLNPGPVSSKKRQIEPRYRIRRGEALRPRDQVAWRALVLGGSTAYGAMISREKDTWVYRLEHKIRAAHGPDYDVINGGVSGYNVIENFIHYILLLDELDPDVVLLYVGINDVHPRLIGNIEPDYSNSRIAWRGESTGLPVANPLLASLATYRFLMLREIEQRRLEHLYNVIQRPYPPLGDWPAALDRNGTDVYRRHLRNLVRLILAQDRRVVIVPQVFLPRNHKHYKQRDEIFARGVRDGNAVNEEVAREFGLPYLAAAETAFESADLLDNCHFSAEGGEKMAQLLFRFLESERATAPSAARSP